ncbi:MAG: hypothetical protein H6510_07245 [Acidobacteria bacterium]|nr:hypothetical protein [Acidobacteriota bacterium]MCB9397591.1 hypothetical protein [Acidobacteriota bacterium]
MIWALMLLVSFQADYKLFYLEGKQLYSEGNYEAALEKFKEAYRLNPKPQRFKTEGTFFDDYQPRYWIARCYEHIDVLEAEKWMAQSKEALEGDVSKKRELVAEYNRDQDRITRSAGDFRRKRNLEYDSEIEKARALANDNQFDAAEQAYRELARRYPLRSEAKAGLETLPSLKRSFLEQKYTALRLAVAESRFADAERLLADMRRVDAQFTSIKDGERLLADAREKASQPAKEPTPQPVKTPVEVTHTDPQPKNQSVSNPPAPSLDREALRLALLETLKPYRRGDPQTALNELERLDLPHQEESASYLWLRGLLNLETYRMSPQPRESQLKEAETWVGRLLQANPDFEPDPKLYPDYVLTFVVRLKAGQ